MKKILLRQLIMLSKRLLYAFLIQLFLCTVLLANTGNAQRKTIEDIKVSLNLKEKTLLQFFKQVEAKTDFKFTYNNDLVNLRQKVTVVENNLTLYKVLVSVSRQTRLNFVQVNENIHVKSEDSLNNQKAVEIAQVVDVTVSGNVTDENGEPIPGVTVSVPGTTTGTTTDLDGNYTLSVPEGSTLVFSFIGFETQSIAVGDRSVIDVTLSEDMASLDEVVVIGYGTMERKDLTGAVSSVNVEQLENERPQNIQDILRGNVVGMEVGRSMTAKGGGSLELRGNNSLKTSSSPLIVLDGVIYPGAMEDINPYDILRLDVLKDASSAAVFGSRAANGVIMITTKKGSIGEPIINFTAHTGLATTATMAPLYKDYDFVSWRQDVLKSQNRYSPATKDKLYKFDNPNNLPEGVTMDMWLDGSAGDPQDIWLSRVGLLSIERNNYAAGKSINWEDMVYQSGVRQDYNLSTSGKKDEVSYFWSMGYNKNEGIIVGDEYATIRSRLNLDSKINNWLTVGLNFQFANRDESAIPASWLNARDLTPWGSLYYDDGITLRRNITEDNLQYNAVYDMAYQDRRAITNTLFSSLYTEMKLPLGITYKVSFAPRFEWYEYMNHQSALHESWALFGGQADRTQRKIYSWQLDNLIKWNKTINNIHKIDLTFLVNAEKYQSWENSMRIQGFSPTDALGYHNFEAGLGTTTRVSTSDQYETGDALMARGFYSLKDRYIATLTMRRDGYSAFGINHPRGLFPAAALGWVFSDEAFLKNDFLTFGKLRLSWGENGNREVGRYAALSEMGLSRYPYQTLDGSLYESNILNVITMANSDLRWEKTSSVNLGVDFEIKNGLLDGTIELYQQRTLDLLVDRALPDITGVPTVAANLGELENKGFEMNLNARVMDKANLKWRTTFNFSLNRNKIIHLYGDMVDVLNANGDVTEQKEADDITNLWFIGRAIDEIWDPVVLGIWQIEEEEEAALRGQYPGDFKLKDVDNSGTINYEDHEFQGFRTPRFQWYMRQEFNIYKNFDLSFTVYSHWGHKGTFNQAQNNDRLYPDRFNSFIVPYWTPENPLNDWARINSSAGGTVFNVYRDRSFIRFDNLTLTYSVPNTLLSKANISNLRLTGTIRNLGWWAPNWEFVDPESAVRTSNQTDTPEPTPRFFTLSVNLTL